MWGGQVVQCIVAVGSYIPLKTSAAQEHAFRYSSKTECFFKLQFVVATRGFCGVSVFQGIEPIPELATSWTTGPEGFNDLVDNESWVSI